MKCVRTFDNRPKFKLGTLQVSSLVLFLSKSVVKRLHLTERRAPASHTAGPGQHLDSEISYAD